MVFLLSYFKLMFNLSSCTAHTPSCRPLVPFDRAFRPISGGFQGWDVLGIFYTLFLAFLSVSMVFTIFMVFTLTMALFLGMLVMSFFCQATLHRLGVGLAVGGLLHLILSHEEDCGGHLYGGGGGGVDVGVLLVNLATSLDLGLFCFTWS